ncbi:ABC transporter-like [Trema orientale]|uniref:ABC transporter-like n=1 Tax=Trema orientale TaxID=63057 RepID=A0A2P5FTU2_TREOI|nr:ABC transporter-like [Trema orientale]
MYEKWRTLVTTTSPRPTTHHHQVLNIADVSTLEPRPPSFVLRFSNLTYSVRVRRWKKKYWPSLSPRTGREPAAATEVKTILNDISGEVYNGEILALLGASGSGKTTLIDALANRIEKESLKGTVTLNGELVDSRFTKAITGYVMQDDVLYPMLTVEETLTFAADFRLPRTVSRSKKMARVQALIDQLGLRNAANTIIGDEGHRGVSGGERRRVSIGVDVIHNPILLFLDEPTSGLDSTSALMVVRVLKSIAQSGSVVVMSVHQPRYRILGLLDRLIFLSGGEMVYCGSPRKLGSFCSDLGHPIPENANPVEFMLDIISELEKTSPSGIAGLVEFNKKSSTGTGDDDRMVLPLKQAVLKAGKFMSSSNFANPLWVEIIVLSKRSTINSKRTPLLFLFRLLTLLMTGFLLSTIYWQLDDSAEGIQERVGFFAFAITTTYFSSCQSLPLLLQERYIFARETAFNAYRRSSYALSHTLAILPQLFLLSLAFSTATFWAIGLAGGFPGFLFYLLTIYGSFWAGNSLVAFLSGLVPHVMVGFTVVVAVSAYFLLLSGFFIRLDRIPSYWIWFHYLSLVKYPYEAVMRSEFEDPSRCFVSAALGVVNNTTSSSACLKRGLNVLKERGITELNKWECLAVLVAWGFFYRILFYISLLLGKKNNRK